MFSYEALHWHLFCTMHTKYSEPFLIPIATLSSSDRSHMFNYLTHHECNPSMFLSCPEIRLRAAMWMQSPSFVLCFYMLLLTLWSLPPRSCLRSAHLQKGRWKENKRRQASPSNPLITADSLADMAFIGTSRIHRARKGRVIAPPISLQHTQRFFLDR